nr:DapH/DapD/GlmU-related protein [Streptomyces sp. ISL-24]
MWIGSNVVVLDGVTIGDHCVIGAGAVVTKDVPPWTVTAGNPARPVRDRRTGRTTGAGAPGASGWRTPWPDSPTRPVSRPPSSSTGAGTPRPAGTSTGLGHRRPCARTATPSRSPTCCWARPRRRCPGPSTPNGCVPCRTRLPDWSPNTDRTAAPARCPHRQPTVGLVIPPPSTTCCRWATLSGFWARVSPTPFMPPPA